MNAERTLPLSDIRVIDAANVIASPGAAARLGDFGAEVVKIEHPSLGDPTRRMGWEVDGTAMGGGGSRGTSGR